MPAPCFPESRPRVFLSGFAVFAPEGSFTHRGTTGVQGASAMAPVDQPGREVEVREDLAPYIGAKGLRFHDRSSRLALAATARLIECEPVGNRCPNDEVGVIVGSDGALQSQHEVVVAAMSNPRTMNPKSYPNRGCNVMAGQLSLMFGFRGESSVVSAGYRSSLDALVLAWRKCKLGAPPFVVAAGEGLSEPRAWRARHKGGAGGATVPTPIEAGLACWVQGEGASAIGTGPRWEIASARQGLLQGRSLEAWLDDTLMRAAPVHVENTWYVISREGTCSVGRSFNGTRLDCEAYGATPLLALFQLMGARQAASPAPLSAVVAASDRHGAVTAVVLNTVPPASL